MIKIFSDTSINSLETKVNNWIEEDRLAVINTIQHSQSTIEDDMNFSIVVHTITIFYYKTN